MGLFFSFLCRLSLHIYLTFSFIDVIKLIFGVDIFYCIIIFPQDLFLVFVLFLHFPLPKDHQEDHLYLLFVALLQFW